MSCGIQHILYLTRTGVVYMYSWGPMAWREMSAGAGLLVGEDEAYAAALGVTPPNSPLPRRGAAAAAAAAASSLVRISLEEPVKVHDLVLETALGRVGPRARC